MSTCQLLTTGYSGHNLDSFLALLQENRIRVVVDVRQNPVSRKKGFSRSKLSEFLISHDIEYLHLRTLGVPKDLRKRLHDGTCGLVDYLEEFRRYIENNGEAVADLYELATRKRCCLICVEQRPEECHRNVVARAVSSFNGRAVEIVHV